MTIGVGQPVECIDIRGSACLQLKQVYTCLAIDGEFLRVECCGIMPSHQEPCWFAWRFRPIIERKTDIGFAHEILRKASRTKRAVAPVGSAA